MSIPPPAHGPNRRAATRKALRHPATIALGDATRPVRTWDLGRDGMSLLSPRPIAPGTRCKVTFDVPLDSGATTVTASMKVVYSSYSAAGEFKIGAVFTDLDDDLARILGSFSDAP